MNGVLFAMEKPTVEQVQEYQLSIRAGIDAEQFVDFYTAKGWMIGKNKMVDWKAAVRTWKRKNVQNVQTVQKTAEQVEAERKQKAISQWQRSAMDMFGHFPPDELKRKLSEGRLAVYKKQVEWVIRQKEGI